MNIDVWEALEAEGWIKALAAGMVTIEEVKHRAEFLERALIDVSKPQPVWSSGIVSSLSIGAIQPRKTVNINNLFHNSFQNVLRQAFANPPVGILGLSPVAAGFYEVEPVEPPDPPELPVTKSETPVVGFRTWEVEEREPVPVIQTSAHPVFAFHSTIPSAPAVPTLRSPVTGSAWDGPILRADGPPAPYDPHDWRWKDRDDHCYGIYAHADPDWRDFHYGYPAMGKVEGWGRVVVHEHGWRAENVRIVSLMLHPCLDMDIAGALADRYHCDVTFDLLKWRREA